MRIRHWLNQFYRQNGYMPTRIWVDKLWYQDALWQITGWISPPLTQLYCEDVLIDER